MSRNADSVPVDSPTEANFFRNKLQELAAIRQHKLTQTAAPQQEIANLDQEMHGVSRTLERFEMYNQVFAHQDTWSHINRFVSPENGTLFRMLQVNRAWQESCNQSHAIRKELKVSIARLFEKNDWATMNQLFSLSSRPAMRMKMLYNTLKKRPANPHDRRRANLKRFVEDACGIELLTHVGTKFIQDKNVVTHVCKILLCFDDSPDHVSDDSDGYESNGETESAVFISNQNMLNVANMLLAMFRQHATVHDVSNLLKKTMHHLNFHEVLRQNTNVQDVIGGLYVGSQWPFRPFTPDEIAARQRLQTQQTHALTPACTIIQKTEISA